MFEEAVDYALDAAQRGILFLDVMGVRGNQYREHLTKKTRHSPQSPECFRTTLISGARHLALSPR